MDHGGVFRAYAITALPENLNRQAFVDALLRKQFAMYHDLSLRKTFLMTAAGTDAMLGAFPGLEIGNGSPSIGFPDRIACLVIAGLTDSADLVGGMYRLFGGLEAGVLVVFTPMGFDEVMSAKLKTERLLSEKETGMTESTSTRGEAVSQTASRHRDSYSGSEETDFLMGTLEMLKSAALANGSAYKVLVFLTGDYAKIEDYLGSKLTVLERKSVRPQGLEALCALSSRTYAMPFSSAGAATMIGFSNAIRMKNAIGEAIPESAGEISLGLAMEGSVRETGGAIAVDASSFNLGTLISGVPGTGKTFAAMLIAKQLTLRKGLQTVIVSPTSEWNAFGRENGINVMKLQRPGMRFNFFKCDSGMEIRRFYENLAMLLASASEAGPYTNSLEKCFLAAFRRVYAKERAPDPVDVYEAIEEAIIEQHGRRSATGVRYTKHGENTRSALENLRSMLNRPEFSKKDGTDFAELLKDGVVFDLSGVSNKMKQFYYALILNQAYSVADQFDTLGDNELRILICLEEAQTVFKPEKYSAATADLTMRIQDFRKKGVGLMLVAHSITDIEPEIRRLCQTKLYFRQSADVARFAANDLLFAEADRDALVERLKCMEQRVCACSYMQGRERISAAFVKLPEYASEGSAEAQNDEQESTDTGEMTIRMSDDEGKGKEGVRIQLFYVGEKVYEGKTDADGIANIGGTIKGNRYGLVVLGEKRKDSKRFVVRGGEVNIVKI